MKHIAIIGAGVGGMTAAYDLAKAGHSVVVYDSAVAVGGLAGGFKDKDWEWSLEKFYHHWFLTDKAIFRLINELGWKDKVIVPKPKTVVFFKGKFYPLDSPIAALTFPGFTIWDMVRFGLVTAYLRYLSNWKGLEKYTSHEWMKKAYGEKIYATHFEPLLVGKFGAYYQQVTMAWFWARFKARTTRLATFRGGFQAFCDLFAAKLRTMGVEMRLSTYVKRIESVGDKWLVQSADKREQYDQVLVTSSPSGLARLVPSLPQQYLSGLFSLKHMGALVLILAIRHPLSKEGYYWFNLPKKEGFPFLALVEHTNFLSPEHYGGDHLLYCGDYLEQGHEHFNMEKAELLNRFLPSLRRINPDFSGDWIRASWLWKADYAQPVPLINHSRNIPAINTPLHGLYFASMSQVYPWDRGTNFAVEIARKAVGLMEQD
jgi:protoporphyrinogen oxidase